MGAPGLAFFETRDSTRRRIFSRTERNRFARLGGGEPGLTPITTAGDEMQVTAAVVACESAGHGLRLHRPRRLGQ